MKIAALLLTGEAFYATRAKACFETWLRDFDHCQIHSYAPCDFLPIARVGTSEGMKSCFDKRHCGYVVARTKLPVCDWYLCGSCDAYFWEPNLRQALWGVTCSNSLSIPLLVGGPRFSNPIPNSDKWVIYPAGGGGYCLNWDALNLIVENLIALRTEWKEISNNWLSEDVFIGWAAEKLGIKYIEHPGFHQENPLTGAWPYQTTREKAISYHRVSPEDMRKFYAEKK